MEYPIHGSFWSKRGIIWNYTVYSDGTIEQWRGNMIRCTGGWKTGKATYVKPTKELKKYIKDKYGIKCE